MAEKAAVHPLLARLEAALPAPDAAALRLLEHLCRERGISLFLVGGAVRDLLLGRGHVDLDLAVESDAGPLAEDLAALTAGRCVVHPRFGTASVSGAGFHLDIARTRRETYASPGALPAVEPATLVDDLKRRDFTINALALRLTQPGGELIDPFGGADDLDQRLLRVLHDASFRDDATRMLRGVRYAARLGARFETATESLIGRDRAFLEAISGPRLRRELALLFEDEGGPPGVLLAQRLGILEAVHPRLRLREEVAVRWRDALAGHHLAPVDELGFCVVADPLREEDVEAVSSRLHLLGRVERALLQLVRLRSDSDKLAAAEGSPAAAVELLDAYQASAVWALSVLEGGAAAETCIAYLGHWRRVRPHLNGHDLTALGVAPGADFGRVLRELRRARLDGRAWTREDEIELVRRGLAGGE